MELNKEEELIGALLSVPNKLAEYPEITEGDFSNSKCKMVFTALLSLWKQKKDTSVLAIKKETNLSAVWLNELQENAFVTSIPFLVKELVEHGKKARIAKQLHTITASFNGLHSADEILNDLLNLYKSEVSKEKKDPEIRKVIERFIKTQHDNRKYGILGVSTGLDVFDKVTINLILGRLYIIGAYTSIGKTALAIEMLCRMYNIGKPSGILITTEMTEEAIISRMVANRTGVNSEVVYSGRMLANHRQIADEARDSLAGINLKIYDNIKTIEQIENVIRLAELQGGVDFVIIDFIQNIRKFGCRSKYEESSQIAIDLQNLAKDCKTAVVCLSQLTLTQAENDSLAFKGAGELAEAADVGVYLKRSKDDKSRLKVEIKKNRHGPLNETIMQYQNNWTRLEEVTE